MALCSKHENNWNAALDIDHPPITGWVQHGDTTGVRSVEALTYRRKERARHVREYLAWVKASCAAGKDCEE